MTRNTPNQRSAYTHFTIISTRWNDNDPYAHVNNAVYYEWFDTAINGWLIRAGTLDIASGDTVGLVVHTACDYFSPIAFPDQVHAGIRVARLGSSSVTYEVGIFRNDEDAASAQGTFVHVYVDRQTSRPMPLAPSLRELLTQLQVAEGKPG